MTQHIIDTDELEKLPKYAWSDVGAVPCNRGDYIHIDDFRKLIANSPQADGMVLVPSEPTELQLKSAYEVEAMIIPPSNITDRERVKAIYKAMLSAYKPQADDVPPDVYDIVVDTGDGIYHTAEVVHFQQSGSKRMIQVRLGEPQADDVRKDAERYRWLRDNAITCQTLPTAWCVYGDSGINNHPCDGEELDQAVDQAIDKARE